MNPVSFVLPCFSVEKGANAAELLKFIALLNSHPLISQIVCVGQFRAGEMIAKLRSLYGPKIQLVAADTWISADCLVRCFSACDTDRIFLNVSGESLEFERRGIEKFLEVAKITGSGIVYSDYRERLVGDVLIERTTADYKEGSIRRSFDFGPLMLFSKSRAASSLAKHGVIPAGIRWNALHDLRLKMSLDGEFARVAEPLYAKSAPVLQRRSPDSPIVTSIPFIPGPSVECLAEEEESIINSHLKRTGAWIEPGRSAPTPGSLSDFPVVASVIIPVRNRAKTIESAIKSALGQRTSFTYNIIVADDHSVDGTAEIVRELARKDERIVHLLPTRKDLGIGGLWNEAIYSPECGAYCIQLDSDDVYEHERAIEAIVTEFWGGNGGLHGGTPNAPLYGMVLGSFRVVDFDLNQIPPGLCQNRFLSRANVRNSLLVADGASAPRAFYVPVLREYGFPNVSFGEDYAVALRISRDFDVGRVFDSLCLVRRWEDNTTKTLPYGQIKGFNIDEIVPSNSDRIEFLCRLQSLTVPLGNLTRVHQDTYKDYLRTIEIQARKIRLLKPSNVG